MAIGKIKERALSELNGEYIKRLGKYCALEIVELAEENITARESEGGIKRGLLAEAARIIDKLRPGAYTVALDMGGDAPDSAGVAGMLRTVAIRHPEIIFIIGGSHGLHPDVLAKADYVLSMSNMTFPHQLARLILLEQLFRAFKINNNETYHK